MNNLPYFCSLGYNINNTLILGIYMSNSLKFICSNGLHVVCQQTTKPHTFTIRFYVRVGTIYETVGNNGITHLLEHMLFRGNKTYASAYDLAYSLEKTGGEINGSTDQDTMELWLTGDVQGLEMVIANFYTFLMHPTFPELDLEKKVIHAERLQDFNDKNQCIDPDTLMYEELFANSYGLPIIGSQESVESCLVEDLHVWHKKFFVPSNCLLVLQVPWDIKITQLLAMRTFDKVWYQPTEAIELDTAPTISWNQYDISGFIPKLLKQTEKTIVASKTTPTKQKKSTTMTAVPCQTAWVKNADNQSIWRFTFVLQPNNWESKIQAQIELHLCQRLLEDGLSSQLNQMFRDQTGLAYHVEAQMVYHKNFGLFYIDFHIPTEHTELFLDTVQYLLNQWHSEITDQEVEKVKFRYQFDLKSISNAELREREIDLLWSQETFCTIDEEKKYIQSISTEHVKRQIQQLFLETPKHILYIGPKPTAYKKRINTMLKVLETTRNRLQTVQVLQTDTMESLL
jgi:predicted Zn-dependent peptidase